MKIDTLKYHRSSAGIMPMACVKIRLWMYQDEIIQLNLAFAHCSKHYSAYNVIVFTVLVYKFYWSIFV